MAGQGLVRMTEAGFYCEEGDFYIDPWRPVPRAVVTHAHSDHLTPGCRAYLVAEPGRPLFEARLGGSGLLQTLPYGQSIRMGSISLSLHPAGHILGSAQVRIERDGEVWVLSGDYKLQPDATCAPFETVRCSTFITEATFALPIYRWPDPTEVFQAIDSWWRSNQSLGQASLLYAYPLGKSQRIIAGVDSSIGPIYTHGSVERLNQAYRQAGVKLPPTPLATEAGKIDWSQALILAPLSASASPWVRRFGAQSSAFASGWMRVRGMRRRRSIQRGFVLSDHADWPGLLSAIQSSGAQNVGVTHGYTSVLARWLRESGLESDTFSTRFTDEEGETGLEEETG